MKASEILREAAKEVDAHWVRGSYGDNFGRVCAIGAMRKVSLIGSSYNPSYSPAVRALAEVLRDQFGEVTFPDRNSFPPTVGKIPEGWWKSNPEQCIVYANDHLAKDRTDISRAMEKAAIQLEEQA